MIKNIVNIEKYTTIYPLTMVHGEIQNDKIVKNKLEIVDKKINKKNIRLEN